MNDKQKIEKELQWIEKFSDPVLLMVIFLTVPAVIIATIFSSLGSGSLIKIFIALCFIFFTWLAFKVSAIITQHVVSLKAQLKSQK